MMAGKNILIVDDEPRNLQLMRAILKSEYRLYFAKSGEEALERVKQSQIDLILLDVMMPGLDGFAVCKILKQSGEYNQIPILFVTALSPEDGDQRCLDAGAIGHLTKPIDPLRIQAMIKNAIG